MNNLEKLSEKLGIELNEDTDIDEVIEDNNLVYDEIDECYINVDDSSYCEIEQLVTHSDNTFYCDFSEQFFTDHNYSQHQIGRKTLSSYWEGNLQKFDLVMLESGDIINSDCACFVEEEGEYYHQDECYYWESDNEYHLAPEPEEPEVGELFGYHSDNRENYSGDSRLKIGFEVEKEDLDVRENIDASSIFAEHGWACESDGSLNSESGFEAVSPCFNLYADFKTELDKVKELLNANYSKACGGHITISEVGYSSEELFDEIVAFIPLLYSLYTHRVGISYCEGKDPKELKEDKSKYSAVNFKSRGMLEIRIFPAVRNVKNLLWRIEFIKIMMANRGLSSLDVISMLLDENSLLTNHLLTVISVERLKGVIKQYVTYVIAYGENFSISKLSEIEKSIKNLKTN